MAPHPPDEPDAVVDEAVRRELALLDPAVRAEPSAVLALLHPDFVEVGASGRTWDAQGIAAALAEESAPTPVEASDLRPVRLADGVVLLTYTAHGPGRVSRRSSVWVSNMDGAWLLRYHQGTVAQPRRA